MNNYQVNETKGICDNIWIYFEEQVSKPKIIDAVSKYIKDHFPEKHSGDYIYPIADTTYPYFPGVAYCQTSQSQRLWDQATQYGQDRQEIWNHIKSNWNEFQGKYLKATTVQ